MKILVLLSRIPYPLEKGDKLRAWHHIRELSEKHEIYLVCLTDSGIPKEAEEKLRPYCKEIRFFQLNKLAIAGRLFLALFSSKPFQVHYFHSRWIHSKIRKYIAGIKPDHVFTQLIRASEYVKNIHHIPKTLDYMDALSKGMERRVVIARGIKKIFLQMEAKRLLEYESLIFDYFENKTIISEQDRNLIYHPDQKKIKVVCNGVDTDYFQPIESLKQFDLSFNGNMSYPPNIDGAVFLCEKIVPILNKEGILLKTLISGANPTNQVKQLGVKFPSVTVSGWMDDIREAYSKSKIFIAPMQLGTGLQNKLLEAMAMGLPCITTQLANNALGAKPEEEILIGNTPQELANQIKRLLNDPALYSKIATNGKKLATNRFNWKTATAGLLEIIEKTKK